MYRRFTAIQVNFASREKFRKIHGAIEPEFTNLLADANFQIISAGFPELKRASVG